MSTRIYAVVSSGGRKHIGQWWEPTYRRCRCDKPQEAHWWPICYQRGAFEKVDGPADCKRCYVRLESEYRSIDYEVSSALSQLRWACNLAAEAEALAAKGRKLLDTCIDPQREIEMDPEWSRAS